MQILDGFPASLASNSKWVGQRRKNLGSRVALLPGKFLRVRKVFAHITENNLNCPNTFKTIRIFPDDFQFSGWFQNCPDFIPDDCQFSRWFQNCLDFFQMTANFPDDFKTVRIFQMTANFLAEKSSFLTAFWILFCWSVAEIFQFLHKTRTILFPYREAPFWNVLFPNGHCP